jgi:hypothetical protein
MTSPRVRPALAATLAMLAASASAADSPAAPQTSGVPRSEATPSAASTWQRIGDLAAQIVREVREGRKRAEAGFPKPNIMGMQMELEARIQAAVASQGYPRASTSGQASADAFWQALDECSTAFRRAQLPKLEAMFDAGLMDGARLAQFIDALLIEEGQPQRFGTVVLHGADALSLAPLADRAALDERRARYGLLPLAQYMALMEKLHGKPFHAPRPANAPAQAK